MDIVAAVGGIIHILSVTFLSNVRKKYGTVTERKNFAEAFLKVII